ncbi:MAG: hypothetical protein ABI426_02955 [Flavobacterium sp.]
MKKIIAFCSFLFLLNSCASAQKDSTIINQKLDTKVTKEIVLVKMINDSRCPEGVQCIWAGEITFEVAAYENKKLVEQTQFTLNPGTTDEVKSWFVKHLPATDKELKGFDISPYPKNGAQLKPEDYLIRLVY